MKYAFCIAGSGSGVGKTTITVGLLRALSKRGLSPAPFKCGPDYIDPGFHQIACGSVSRNLDTWMMGEEAVTESFRKNSLNSDIAVIEGVMGLFDGADVSDITGSTAHVAKLLDLPVLLVVNARGIAGTIAPLVKGFVGFRKGVNIAGIIANNVGSEKHAEILSDALKAANLPPLLGFLTRDQRIVMPERHLGLVPAAENKDDFYDIAAENVEKNFMLDMILEKCRIQDAGCKIQDTGCKIQDTGCTVKLAIAKDDAFHFYYEDNLDMLREAGIELVPFSPVADAKLPEEIKGIYIGGGFPECFAAELAENVPMKQAIAKFANSGGFIYAECGGLMYLTHGITAEDNKKYNMCGIIPVWTRMENKLKALGYREIRTTDDSPFGPKGTLYRGHEFHWSSVIEDENISPPAFCEIRNARKSEWKPTGYRRKNVFASYIHAHFSSNKQMIGNIINFLLGR